MKNDQKSVGAVHESTLRWIFLFFLIAALPAFAQPFHPEALAELEKDQIWVDVTLPAGSTNAITQFRVWYPYKAEKVFEVLMDVNNFARYHKGNYYEAKALDKATYDRVVAAKPQTLEELQALVRDAKIKSDAYRKKGATWTGYSYVNFNFPWPLSNRWGVVKFTVDETRAKQGIYRHDFEMPAGNFKSNSGYWELVPVAGKEDWTEFRGRYVSDPGISLPSFATKLGTKMGFKREVDENRELLRKRHGDK